MYGFIITSLLALLSCGSDNNGGGAIEPPPAPEPKIEITPADLAFNAAGETRSILVNANADWVLTTSGQNWCTASEIKGYTGETSVRITVLSNNSDSERTAVLRFTSGKYSKEYPVRQLKGEAVDYVPAGYTLVWHDEFNDPRLPGGKPALPNTTAATGWWYETGKNGWGNNELQNYIAGVSGTDTCAMVTDGTLKIIAMKKNNEVISVRINTKESWQYGYFEARLRLPVGKGTWPAYWMLPKNFLTWPDDGEIDIMEEVGYRPNWVSSAIHCKSFNHGIQTEKTAEKFLPTAQSDFHVYALEWTEDYIKTFVDGVLLFTFLNDKTDNKATWPFNVPFYLKLNLAWGGNWGGSQGVDESALPTTYEIDYVRVYQKK